FDEAAATYFVDKSEMLSELIPLTEKSEDVIQQNQAGKTNKYLCITRPRRFGKTVMASMIASFFSKGKDSRKVFQKLKISDRRKEFESHINKHNVIYITFNEIPQNCTSYQKYIERIEKRLRNDLRSAFPDVESDEDEAVWDVLNDIYELRDETRFIFVLDEWDYIFHREFVTDKDKSAYIEFLSNLLKGKAYVEFAYMTGILPIAKYSSGSELNMFYEYTMAEEEKYSEYFGFTDKEVDELFRRYQSQKLECENVTREGLRIWYDGYHTKAGERVYNPRSVVASLTNNNMGNYWTSSGPYDEIFYYIKENVDAVRDDLALMVSGIPVRAKVREYAATSMNLRTKDEIFSAMVVYGFLNYEEGYVSIPNKEVMELCSEILGGRKLCSMSGGVSRRGGWLNPTPTRSIENGENAGHY
uniref:AAA family ATPase n=1 Tax=Coprobacter fastidiosus TaxID=1099853 RepID=UPI003208BAD0